VQKVQTGKGQLPSDLPVLGFHSLAVSPDGKWPASGSDDDGPVVWWNRTGDKVKYHGSCDANGDDTTGLALSPDSAEAVSTSADGSVKIITTGLIAP
jgi:WD40 repeat protein